ncbi:WD repeat domain 3 (predicted), isoform CRA_b [Rattus norvegicus]|uniref:WD repeat domain 3 (Predicted), isoform CRA_b n=1 Tax=Rattus norvegicus TaxID=10116 RepID=A6K3G0_RAT|nr:WD repeat domain 3 (predicted), isoform CRA_b [Rattus norvegicus]
MVKWWDLDNQHCFKTMVGHRTEVWGLVLVSEETRLITGAADSELRAWDIAYLQEIDDPEEPEPKKIKECPGIQDTPEAEDRTLEADDEKSEDRILSCRKAGSLMREGRDRVVNLAVDKTGRILACHGTDSVLEVFCILSKAEVQKKMDKKLKKARKKARLNSANEEEDPETSVSMTLQDEILRVTKIKTSAKIKSTLQCIRTMPCEYALCSFFVPGDRQVVIGTKTGNMQLYDLASGNLLETIAAHDGALWSMSLSPDQRGFVTGGADKAVKFWDFELVTDKNSTQKRLSVKQTRILQLDEDVLYVCYSPDQRLLAVSLLDCTVKIFYVDTLKFFLSLYGHKLPVICMDISHDGALIATGSADRNVKIWGLDFGDCHRSLFAHDDRWV